jgi:hypothetical protein
MFQNSLIFQGYLQFISKLIQIPPVRMNRTLSSLKPYQQELPLLHDG